MKNLVLFITANDNERLALLEKLENKETKTFPKGVVCNFGDFGRYKVAHYHSPEQGSGAELKILNAINAVTPSYVILVGIACGANHEKQKIGEVLVSHHAIDYDCRKEDYNIETKVESVIWRGFRSLSGATLYGLFNGHCLDWQKINSAKVYLGDIISSNVLLNNPTLKSKIFSAFHNEPIGYEMESASAFRVCHSSNMTEWILVKGICDFGDGRKSENKQENQELAAKNAVSLCHYVFSQDGMDSINSTGNSSNNLPDMENFMNDMKKYYELYKNHFSATLRKIQADEDSLDVEISYNNQTVSSLDVLIPKLQAHNILFLLGNGGSGKTYAFFKSWSNLILNRSAIFVQLHLLDTEQPSIKALIDKNVLSNNPNKIECFYRTWTNNHGSLPLILFLDGFNEISTTIQTKVWREVQQLQSLNVIIIISSRYADNLKIRIRDVFRADMNILSTSKIKTYLEKKHADVNAINNKKLLALLTNPLMLSLYAQTSKYYDVVAVNRTKTECGGSVKFYGPIFSESTIIWNFFQYELMKEIEEFDSSNVDKLYSFLVVNFILPFICYKMQPLKYTITSKQLRDYIEKALRIYCKIDDNSEKFRALKGYLGYFELVTFDIKSDVARIFFLSTNKLQLFRPISMAIGDDLDNDETKYELSHQQMRDCLAAIHLINGMELCDDNSVLHCLATDDIRINQSMVQHVAYLEDRNDCLNINKQWGLLKSLSSVKMQLLGKELKLDLLINNLVNVYKFIYNGNFSTLNFEGVDLRYVSLNGFKFQPVINSESFKDTVFGTRTFTLGGHSGAITDLAAYGNKLLSRDADSVRMWNIDTGECVDIPFIEEEYNDDSIGFRADILPTNENVIVYSQGVYVIEKNLATEEEKNFEGNSHITYLTYSSNGQYIMSCGEEGEVNIWDRSNSKNPIYSNKNVSYCQTDISRNCVILFKNKNTIDNNNSKIVQVVDFVSQKEIVIPYSFEQEEQITAACFTPDGISVIFATTKKIIEENRIADTHTLHLWKIGENNTITTLCNSSEDNACIIKTHKNCSIIATISTNGKATLWSIENISSPRIIISFNGVVSITFFNSTSLPTNEANRIREERGFFVGFSSGEIYLYELHNETSYIYTKYDGHRPYAYDLALSPKEPQCIGAYSDGVIRLWNYETGLPMHNYIENRCFVDCVEYDPSGELFASGHTNGSIWLWDVETKLPIGEFKDGNEMAHGETVRDIVFTNDGKLISCSNDKTIKIWNIETREVINTLKEHTNFVKCLLYYEDEENKRLVSGSTDKSIIIWDVLEYEKCQIIKKHVIHTNRVRSLSMYQSRHSFVSNSEDGFVYEWDIITGEKNERQIYVENEYNKHHESKRSAEAIAYSDNGNQLIIGTERSGFNDTGIVATLDLMDFNNAKISSYLVHTGAITAVNFIDDNHIISSSMDGTICITNLHTNNVKALVPNTSFIDELKGYNLEVIKFAPNWIRSYYYGAPSITSKMNVPQTLDSLLKAYQCSIGLNLFDFITREEDISILTDLFLAYTHGTSSNNDRAMLAKEKQFLLANIYYLWKEAPDDEKNMYMLAELFRAYEVREGQEDYESDLDRLFSMLEEKDSNHIALRHYKKFKRYYGSDKVVKSCISRLESVCCDFSPSENINNGIKSVEDYERFIETFQSNTRNQKGADETCSEAERLLIITLLEFMRSNSYPAEQLTSEFTKVLMGLSQQTQNDISGDSWTTQDLEVFRNLPNKDKTFAIRSFISRFSFFGLFKEAEKVFNDFETGKVIKAQIDRDIFEPEIIEDKISSKEKSIPKNFKQEEVEIVELFDENGESLIFELLSTIEDAGNKYFVLTPFIEDESQIDFEVPSEVFVMQQVTKESNEKMLEPVADTTLVEKIFNIFKNGTKDKFNFADN